MTLAGSRCLSLGAQRKYFAQPEPYRSWPTPELAIAMHQFACCTNLRWSGAWIAACLEEQR